MADIVKLIYKGDEMAQWGGGSVSGPIGINYTEIKQRSNELKTANETASLTYTPAQDGWLMVKWQENIYQWKLVADMSVSWSLWWNDAQMSWTSVYDGATHDLVNSTVHIEHLEYIPVKKNQTVTITQTINNDSSFSWATSWIQQFCLWWFMYYEI